MPRIERWQLDQRRAQPVELKIRMSLNRIRMWYEHWDGEVYVAFSGGLDSTVLLHLVRSVYPNIPAVFFNTGMEYPEIVRHVRATEGVHWLQPAMRFPQVIRKYGWPVVSKRISQYVHEILTLNPECKTSRLRRTGYTENGDYRPAYMLSRKWQFLLDAPFRISPRCCHYLKKRPALDAERQYGKPYLGMTASEGDQRLKSYLDHGCNAFDLKRPRSWPLAFWTHQDILEYVSRYDVPYAAIYDMGYTRTGCYVCPFGVHLEDPPNRFQRMRVTHPKLWTYCIDRLGLGEVLDYLSVPYE